MHLLSRIVRFAINPAPSGDVPERGANGYAGSPPFRGLARHYEVQVVCEGHVDPVTSYLIDIKTIDDAVRSVMVPRIELACREHPHADPALILPELFAALTESLRTPARSLRSLRWMLTPFYSVQIMAPDTTTVLLRQRFDFSASHRLHVPALSDEENRRLFGKCNNPSGHGHNYQFEPCVALPAHPEGSALSLGELERIADQIIIRRFDHKYLNTDTDEFRTGSGVNPSVENIARVFFDLLAPAIARAAPDASLRSVTVWETDRTSATYPA